MSFLKNIAKIKEKLSDKEIFGSESFKAELLDSSAFLYKKYRIKKAELSLIIDNSSTVAYTTNDNITINITNRLLKNAKNLLEKYLILVGLYAHEVAHRLFTNFQVLKLSQSYFSSGTWFPFEPKLTNFDDILNKSKIDKLLKEGPIDRINAFIAVHGFITNAIEDGRIEELFYVLCKNFGKLTEALNFLREIHFHSFEKFDELYTLAEDEESNYLMYNLLLYMILSYAKYGEIKGITKSDYNKDIVKTFVNLSDLIDEAIEANSTAEVYDKVNHIMIRTWPYIEEYFETLSNQDSPSSDEKSSQDSSSSDEKSSSSSSSSSSDSKENTSSSPLEEKVTKNLKEHSSKGTSETGTGSSTGISEHELKKAKTESSKEKGTTPATTSSPTPDHISVDKNHPDEKDEEGGRIKEHETSEIYKGMGDGKKNTTPISIDEGSTKESALGLKKIVDKLALEKLDKELENELINKSNSFAKEIFSKSNNHRRISSSVYRPLVSPSNIGDYNSSAKEIVKIAEEAARKVKPLLEEQDSDWVSNRFYGTKFNVNSTVKKDLKYFSQKKAPLEPCAIAVAVIVDESGSMSCSGRASSARATAIALYEFCNKCNIPIGVYGHTADEGSDLSIFCYADFDKKDTNDKYRLMNIKARSNNRDGAALLYGCEKLYNVNADVKLLFIISDGQPHSNGYSGSSAEADMKQIVAEYSKKDIKIFAAAIGNDKNAIRRIYGSERFLDITNLKTLPKCLVSIVRRHL